LRRGIKRIECFPKIETKGRIESPTKPKMNFAPQEARMSARCWARDAVLAIESPHRLIPLLYGVPAGAEVSTIGRSYACTQGKLQDEGYNGIIKMRSLSSLSTKG
jgi:hypothetical protein